MGQTKWFERRFDFSIPPTAFPIILERLKGTPIKLAGLIHDITEENLIWKPENTWSIKENVGHLIDLEPLWQTRLENILNNEPVLASTDLENNKTSSANHNQFPMKDLLIQFEKKRELTLRTLVSLEEKEISKSALHPRLKIPMRILDLFQFVAEHDAHHLVRISEIKTEALEN